MDRVILNFGFGEHHLCSLQKRTRVPLPITLNEMSRLPSVHYKEPLDYALLLRALDTIGNFSIGNLKVAYKLTWLRET